MTETGSDQELFAFEAADLEQVRLCFKVIVGRDVAPLLAVCARALGVEVVLTLAEELQLLLPPQPGEAIGQWKTPTQQQADRPPTVSQPSAQRTRAVQKKHLQLAPIGPMQVTIYAPTHPPLSQHTVEVLDFLMRIVRRVMRQAATSALNEVADTLRRRTYLHQYAHGITAIETGLATVLRILGVEPDSSPLGMKPCDEDALPPHDKALLMLCRLEHLARAEFYNTINLLSHLMPESVAGVEKQRWDLRDPMELLVEVLPAYVDQANRQGITIEYDARAQVSVMPSVRLEESSFQRMFHNLLSNAVKYSYHGITRPGSETHRTIRIWCTPKHDEQGTLCAIHIQNYGLAIERDEMGLILKPLYRGRAARSQVKVGTGLGLTDANLVAHAHGGRLHIVSKPVHENTNLTTVSIILPIVSREPQGA